MTDITKEAMLLVLNQKLAAWNQAYYSHRVDAQIAKDIGGMDQMLKAATDGMANAQKIVDKLEQLKAELEDS